jgi:light-regulated signal transduction histidine kinase (bacteriophytochrome)
MQNLPDNAVKFMGNQPKPLIKIVSCDPCKDKNPVLFVQDNGIGIDPKYHGIIFGLFNKLDPKSKGTS